MATILEHPAARRRDGDADFDSAIEAFLGELEHANRSPHTIRAYRGDIRAFREHDGGELADVTPEALMGWFGTLHHLAPATRERKQAAVSSFFAWAYRRDLVGADPAATLPRVRTPERLPRAAPRADVERALRAIPPAKRRDRLLFRLVYETGLRIGEALALHVEDLALTPDDERVTVTGKGGRTRTVLLDGGALVADLRRYLKTTGYERGPLFRAEKNGRGGPLRYQSARELWEGYCRKAGVAITPHQLRHAHATELINGGVDLETIRRRLGHRRIETTLLYAELSDRAADERVRAWRRRRER